MNGFLSCLWNLSLSQDLKDNHFYCLLHVVSVVLLTGLNQSGVRVGMWFHFSPYGKWFLEIHLWNSPSFSHWASLWLLSYFKIHTYISEVLILFFPLTVWQLILNLCLHHTFLMYIIIIILVLQRARLPSLFFCGDSLVCLFISINSTKLEIILWTSLKNSIRILSEVVLNL